MGELLVYSILLLCGLGGLSAVSLYFVAQRFHVYEDPQIDDVEEMLPGANCGGCGFPGCRGLAEAMVNQEDISGLSCPVAGGEKMKEIATFLGKAVAELEPEVAEVRCSGSCEHRPRVNLYDGARSCAVEASLYGGETGCRYGCLGGGDCVDVCGFDAIRMNPETNLPEVDIDKCTACGACVRVCPNNIIELRLKGPKNRRIYVSCMNQERGAVARRACAVACIGCNRCVRVCEFDAIKVENFLAYIDPNKCRLCRKCVDECPTGAIIELNFPVRKPKEQKKESAS